MIKPLHRVGHCWPAWLVALTLSGCAAGPDFQRPDPPDIAGYLAAPHAAITASAPGMLGKAQTIAAATRADSCWWRNLGSAALNELIDEALAASPALEAAQATLRQTREQYAARAGDTRYPQLEGTLGARRQRFNPGSMGQTGQAREFSVFEAGVTVGYRFDLAGSNRRMLEALAARGDYQHHRLEGARLTLVADIATAAITRAGLAAQIDILETLERYERKRLALIRQRLSLGQAAKDEVAGRQTRVAQTGAMLPPLRQQLQQQDHRLATLAGRAPGAQRPHPFTLAEFDLPSNLPLLVPSALVRGRPDILAAEALLHAANAEYGAAVANLYPQLDLSADLGSQALTTGALFGSGSLIWSLAGQLTQPLFKPGLAAEKRAALAGFEAARANYQAVVLEALRQVADVLRALENDARQLASLSVANAAAEQSLEIARQRTLLGAAADDELLAARQQAQQTQLDMIQARTARLLDSVAFCQAMGAAELPASGLP
jgi:NodT family efflux transporter outer membrane factor (OMF) lipoprotein